MNNLISIMACPTTLYALIKRVACETMILVSRTLRNESGVGLNLNIDACLE